MTPAIELPLANRLVQLIEEMNKEFAVVSVGSSIRILRESVNPETGAIEISLLSPADFGTVTRNRILEGMEDTRPSNFFLEHPKRREFRKIDFFPGEAPKDVYNLWHGFSVKPIPGPTQKFWTFVQEVICAGHAQSYQFVRCWLAHLIQHPAELPGTALVLRGKQGTGKNTFADTIGKLVGQHYLTVNSLEQITGRFNGHLANKLLVHANEAIWGGNKTAEGALKAMVTDEWLATEYKGVDVTNVRNFKRLIVSSNEQWAVPRGIDDRRFVVLDVSDSQKENQAYFAAIHEELDKGGLAALLHDLQNQDLSKFNPRTMPANGAGLDMKLRSASNTIRWLYEFLDEGYFMEHKNYPSGNLALDAGGGVVGKGCVYASYQQFCHSIDHSRPEANSQFFKTLKQTISEIRDKRGTGPDGARQREIEFPSLSVARASFERSFKQPGMISWSEHERPTLDNVRVLHRKTA